MSAGWGAGASTDAQQLAALTKSRSVLRGERCQRGKTGVLDGEIVYGSSAPTSAPVAPVGGTKVRC